MKKVSCQLSFYPDYLAAHSDFLMNPEYFADFKVREKNLNIAQKYLLDEYSYFLKGRDYVPQSVPLDANSSIMTFVELFGGRLFSREHSFTDCAESVLGDIETQEELDARIPAFKENTYRYMEKINKIAAENADSRYEYPFHSNYIDGLFNLEMFHCPLTISYKLFGENLLYAFYDDIDFAKSALSTIADLSVWFADYVRKSSVDQLKRPDQLLLSGCSACFISPDHWGEAMIPLVERERDGRKMFFHSCGTINNHIETFNILNKKSKFLKFDVRESSNADLEKISQVMKGVEISYMLSPALCLERGEAEIREAVRKSVADSGESDLHIILMLPNGADPNLGNWFLDECVKCGGTLDLATHFRFV